MQLFGGLPVQFGVFLDAVDVFDAPAFGISTPEALLLDPQQRLLLECAAEVMCGPAAGASSNASWRAAAAGLVGVWVGVSSMDYNRVSLDFVGGVTPYSSTGSSLSVTAGRLSYTYNLRGPSVAVDTACSSSLVGAC